MDSKSKYRLKSQSTQKVAVVTGGSRGIGLALVQRLKREGWLVATCATQKKNLTHSPADFKSVCDVSRATEVKKFVHQTMTQWKRIDLLINNAGFMANNSMDPNTSDDLWHQIMNINLYGTYYFCKYAGHYLPEGSGKILNIASNLAFSGIGDAIAYCAAKHGVLGLTRALAQYFAPRRITVNALCPGWVNTEMSATRFTELGISRQTAEKHIPLGRILEPEEIADFAYYLAMSKGASMLTGQGIILDGGMLSS